MRKTIKVVVALLVMVAIFMTIYTTSSMATGIDVTGIAGRLTGSSTSASSDVENLGNDIIGIITTVGVVVAVVVLLILGIKYMMGSASEKAEYKKTMIPYLVGAILIFGASAITKVVIGLGTGLLS